MRFNSSNETKSPIGKPLGAAPPPLPQKPPIAPVAPEKTPSQPLSTPAFIPRPVTPPSSSSNGEKSAAPLPAAAPPAATAPAAAQAQTQTAPRPQIAPLRTQSIPQIPPANKATQSLPTPSALQGNRSSFTSPNADLVAKKNAPKPPMVNVARFGGLANAAGANVGKETRIVSIPAEANRPLDKNERLLEASTAGARNLLKQCREAGLIAMEEAVKLIPKPSELEQSLQLSVICRKISAQSPSSLQKSICDSMGIPIFHLNLFPEQRKNIPPAVIEALKKNKLIPLGLEYADFQDGRRHGHITVGAEHPFLDELALEICNLNGLAVLFAFVVVIDVAEINSAFGGTPYEP